MVDIHSARPCPGVLLAACSGMVGVPLPLTIDAFAQHQSPFYRRYIEVDQFKTDFHFCAKY
jgi:hypothetical protein